MLCLSGFGLYFRWVPLVVKLATSLFSLFCTEQCFKAAELHVFIDHSTVLKAYST